MSVNAAQLLKLLGSGIRPTGASTNAAAPGVAPGAFADLLKQAREGGLASELPVTIGSDAQAAGVQLSGEQLARVAIAADQLETAGVRHALVTIDGQKLLLDVHAREVSGRPDGSSGLVGGIDGTIDLGDLRGDVGGGGSGGAGVAPLDTSGAQGTLSALRRLNPPAATLTGSASALELLAKLSGGTPVGNGR